MNEKFFFLVFDRVIEVVELNGLDDEKVTNEASIIYLNIKGQLKLLSYVHILTG